ncbi:hypothetical protein HH310_37230 [Actinoplanes sp. TBRC 11911]|uniref:hypothetical protein n=1 Tax=Actinoplanes sp. TBRC 11911 TaxID=2729386 RepID=UPI00145D318D|nr:hypothetical protein [Actinoplanes sp. TBRC 11911]NMO56804.1 hypothetical protein [Actinoplanes sp. TBRC 11911]
MEERRQARIGTVSGLALLAGGTAVAAVAGGAHTIFATLLLGLLTLGLVHALVVEIGRQALRRSAGGWARHDTINAVLLGAWSEIALFMAILGPGSLALRAVGLILSLAYASSCVYFVTKRRRAVASQAPSPSTPAHPTPPLATTASEPDN